MKIKIIDPSTDKKKYVEIKKIIEDYNRLIFKLCNKWIHGFKFDQSIDVEDLIQELRIKLLIGLESYEHKRGSLMTFISSIAKNFFMNKRSKRISWGLHPLDNEGNPYIIIHLSTQVNDNDSENEIMDTLKTEANQENEIELFQLIQEVKTRLNKINYSPRGFSNNGRTFVRTVFDILYIQDDNFISAVMFDYKCRQRYSLYGKSRRSPASVTPTAEMLGEYVGVDSRAINYSYRAIRKVIMECSK